MTTLPNYAVSPGDHLHEWLSDHDVIAAELARRLNVTPKHVSELLSGKAPLSANVALGLERVTGIPARIWNRFEAGYREALARIEESSRLASQYEHAKKFPLSYLRRWGFVSSPARDRAGTVLELLNILGIAHLDAFNATWVHGKVAYRKAKLTTDKAYEQAIWLALGEQEADFSKLSPYSSDSLNALIPQLRSLTADPNPVQAITRAAELLQTAGVALFLVPPIPGFGVDGATRWISDHPIIQLSVRGKKDDQLWFTLFHELGHVLLHPHNVVFLNGDNDEDEATADRFAASTLVPEQYRDRLPSKRSIAAVRELAAELGIAPSIVLGQAQHISGDYAWGQRLRRTLIWDNEE